MTDQLFTPIGFGGAYRRTAELLRARLKICMSVAVVVFPLMLGVQLSAGILQYDSEASKYGDVRAQKTIARDFVAFMLEVFLFTFIEILGKGIVTVTTLDKYQQGSSTAKLPALKECTRRSVRFVCALFCTGLLLELIILIATVIVLALALPLVTAQGSVAIIFGTMLLVFFVVALVYAFVPFLLFYPVIIHEKKGSWASIRRCYTLASGSRLYLGCTVFLFLMVVIVSRAVVGFLHMGVFLRAFLSCLPVVIMLPLITILTTVVYMDLRVKKEGLTAQSITGNHRDSNIKEDETEITEINNDESNVV